MKRNLLAIAAWISGLSLTLSLCAWGGIRQLEICFAGAAFCWGYLCFGKSARLPGRDGSAAVLALVSAGCIWPLLSWLRPENFRLVRWFVGERLALTGWAEPLCVVLSLWLIPALYGLVYAFFNGLLRRLRLIFSRMTRTDRLFWCVGWVLAAAGLVWLFLSSSAFYGAPVEQDAVDVLYTSDSGYLYQQNVYIHVNAGENDIRQPLFGVFALPLSAPLWQLSRLLPYPAYPLLMGVLQAGMLLVCLVLLRQMLGIDGLLPLLCLAALYPVLLFGLMQEQYVFAMLWLMLLVDAHLHGEGDRGWLFGAAAGSMLTSSAFLPLCADWRSWKESLTQMLRALAVFLAMWMIFGRFGGLLDLTRSLSWLTDNFVRGDAPLSLLDKLRQYTWFVRSCFAAPEAVLESDRHGYITWQQAPVDGFSLWGALLLALCCAGFWLCRRQRLAQIAGGWGLCSLALLGIIGYGAVENGMVLYTLYFGWAWWCLLGLGLKRLLPPKGLQIALAALLACLLWLNVPAMAALCRFGITYYPLA